MSDTQHTVTSQLIRNSREYMQYLDGSHWTRKIDPKTGKPGEWAAIEVLTAEPQEDKVSSLHLSVVLRHQAINEPKHRALFSHRPDAAGIGKGQVCQVDGDAEYIHYAHCADVDLLSDEFFAWHQTLKTNLNSAQYARVDQIARVGPPPQAVNRAAVAENCQGWTIRVLRRLVDERVVEESAVTMVQGYMDPV